eukprot:gene40976-biopygen27681
MLRLNGAELIEVPALPFANPNNYQHVGRRLADQLRKTEPNGVLFADQWNNLDNAKAHYESTGPEIWQQTDGKVDGFICALGTGGTIAGASRYLKEKNSNIVTACADPQGFAMYHWFKDGEARSTPGDSITEGIGIGRVTPVIETAKVDTAFVIPDEEAVAIVYDLLQHEGLCLGGSSGINIAGAIRLGQRCSRRATTREHAVDRSPGHTELGQQPVDQRAADAVTQRGGDRGRQIGGTGRLRARQPQAARQSRLFHRLGPDRLLRLGALVERHDDRRPARCDEVEHGVVAGLADRQRRARQQGRKIRSRALDRDVGRG